MKSFIINKYLTKEFLKVVTNMTLAFYALGFVVNLFEEINFFKDYDVSLKVPMLLSLLFIPNLIYSMFPFVILLSGIWFFIKIKRTDEIIAMKVSGMSNFSVILIPGLVSIALGIIFVTSINPVTSVMLKKYESIKGSYERDQDYLAAITVNGIWIKEKNLEKNNIIRASNLEKNNLLNLTIYEFDKNQSFVRRVEAESAVIRAPPLSNSIGDLAAASLRRACSKRSLRAAGNSGTTSVSISVTTTSGMISRLSTLTTPG